MKRFKNILYILDEKSYKSEGSADKVASLARLNEAVVTVMIAGESSMLSEFSLKISGRYEEIKNEIDRQNRERLDQFKRHQRWDGIDLRPDYTINNDFLAIIKKVVREGYDLIIKEDKLEQGIDQLAMKFVRKCPCPVWIIKRGIENGKIT